MKAWKSGVNGVLHSLVTIYRDTKIGDDFLAHSQTVVREGCAIGNRVILQNGVVIGGDGFGFAKRADGRWHKIVQQAPVVIEDDVEIQANSCIDRATVGETRIRRGAKIDDLVLVGHACEVGEDTIYAAKWAWRVLPWWEIAAYSRDRSGPRDTWKLATAL